LRTAKRIDELPPYLFASLDKKISAAKAKGVDVISFGTGDPDRPTPDHIVQAAAEAVRDSGTHQYPSYYGMPAFREAIAGYYERRFSVKLNPETQILPLIGSKEGIAHLATAFVDPGDSVLLPDPGYPVYETSALLSGGQADYFALSQSNSFQPSFEDMKKKDLSKAKLLWLCYPNNPTAATVELDVLENAVSFSHEQDLLLAHDAAYIEITFDGYVAPSVLQVPGALDVAIEFGSLSKTYNMTGWRVAWVVGAEKAIEALSRVKTNIDSGIFDALQRAGIAALEGPQDCVAETVEVYRNRRDALVDALNTSGWLMEKPKGSIYLWVPVPEGDTSITFSEFLLERAGVVVAPGSGYGPHGEGFVRFSLTLADERLQEGAERIAQALKER
jgi:LL-diaminopimelate aminotransferase